MLNGKLVSEVAYMLAATRNTALTMGKLTIAVYGESARGSQRYGQNTKTLAGLLAGKGYVKIFNRGKRNQSVIATPEGLEMIAPYESWDMICMFHDARAADDNL